MSQEWRSVTPRVEDYLMYDHENARGKRDQTFFKRIVDSPHYRVPQSVGRLGTVYARRATNDAPADPRRAHDLPDLRKRIDAAQISRDRALKQTYRSHRLYGPQIITNDSSSLYSQPLDGFQFADRLRHVAIKDAASQVKESHFNRSTRNDFHDEHEVYPTARV